ncbi:nuclear polyadenylated RNA-binding protein Nab2 [Ophiocordyceps sinensis CO18]|uniref:Nuclear polyadenylated RNA-binding protein Nab2 n=1 Tax=Ophiocordyceps sinensis (strain Co18 / CGMCC 3.14243) TaxID=911162 RepID=T5A0W7_OPHSC|nr:nuclear polyadenylated RNA-binding protein Nab2 [Ophiocordyceps sinensis CO18]
MPVEIVLNTPLADALSTAIQFKLVEVGWGGGGGDDAALAEYIILMLVNCKTKEQITAELAGELLGLALDDPIVIDFSRWLFEQIEVLGTQMTSDQSAGGDATVDPSHDAAVSGDMDTDMNPTDTSDLKAPTGPRSMRNGNVRGGRDKRLLGHMHKAMDRSGDNALHRTRGNDRINTHLRAPPTGPRTGPGRLPRHNNTRAANVQVGLAPGGPQGPGWMMQGPQPNQMELMAMLEQQNQMMFHLSQQLMQGGGPNGGPNGGHGQQRRGKSLFARVSDPHHRNDFRKGQNPHQGKVNVEGTTVEEGAGGGADVEMSGGRCEAPNPEETVCRFNLNCAIKECKFAHQSPAAPLGVSVDVSDTCSYGVACKNRKCVARHPSPATKLAHQSEQACKFFPNCQNLHCPFKHPSTPLCRNGPGCSTSDCPFTHVKTKCRYNPCLNPKCVFTHDAGQQGGFRDKVWTANFTGGHVSERKFVDEGAAVEQVKAESEMETEKTAAESEVIG